MVPGKGFFPDLQMAAFSLCSNVSEKERWCLFLFYKGPNPQELPKTPISKYHYSRVRASTFWGGRHSVHDICLLLCCLLPKSTEYWWGKSQANRNFQSLTGLPLALFDTSNSSSQYLVRFCAVATPNFIPFSALSFIASLSRSADNLNS